VKLLIIDTATIALYVVEGQEPVEKIDRDLADASADFLARPKRWVDQLLPFGGPTAVRVGVPANSTDLGD
jgi:hypothetical protein